MIATRPMRSFDRIVATDVDGTLFRSNRTVSETDLQTLNDLHDKGVCTVLATGRSIWSFSNLAGSEFPVDYLVFSCGANHFFFPCRSGKLNPDFEKRVATYLPFEKKVDDITFATQILAIFPGADHQQLISDADKALSDFRVIRSTSPVDNKSLWMEIFHKGVSKAAGISKIADFFGIKQKDIMAVGNDYNDVDMLSWAGQGFITANSPEELKKQYINVPSNNEDGFTKAVELWLRR